MRDAWLSVDAGVVPLLLSDGCHKAEFHITIAAATAVTSVLTRDRRRRGDGFHPARGMALEALRLAQNGTGTAYLALPE